MTTGATPARTLTVQWDDPLAGPRAAAGMAGIEYLSAMIRGELPPPPIARLLGFGLSEVSDGRAVFTGEPGEQHYNPMGAVHGGFAATLLDSAMTCAVLSKLPAGVGCTTVELKVNFVRPITATTGAIRCVAETIHVGGSLATADARIYDRDDRLLGHGSTTCMILRRESRPGAAPAANGDRPATA